MGTLRIDRLTLEAPKLTENAARDLALNLAEVLGAMAGAMPAAGDIPALRLEVVADHETGARQLAEQVAREIVRELRRIP